MTRHALGIDIGEAQVSGVALTRQGRSLQLTGCCRVELAADTDPAGVAAAVRQVGAQLGGPQAVTVLGLPLSRLSVRNLALPFKDARSITQTLPFELEEQLLVPVDSQVSDFLLAGSTPDGGSRVIAFSAEQELLAGLLGGLEGRPDPGVITPTGLALAAAVARDNPPGRPLLLVHLELPAATLVLVDGPVPVLCRRLPWVEPPLQPRAGEEGAEADSPAINPEALRLLAAAVERTIDLYAQESGAPMQPEGVVLTGPLAELDRDSGLLAAFLGVSTQVADLVQTAGATCAAPAEDSGRGRYDAALALALTGLEKRPGINLRRGPFARPRSLFASRKRLAAAGAAAALLAVGSIGLLWNDYRRLEGRDRPADGDDRNLSADLPAVTTVREPYAEMQAAMHCPGAGQRCPPLRLRRPAGAGPAGRHFRPHPRLRRPGQPAGHRPGNGAGQGQHRHLQRGAVDQNGLSASALFSEVKIVSATADKEKGEQGGQIRFELQLQFKEG